MNDERSPSRSETPSHCTRCGNVLTAEEREYPSKEEGTEDVICQQCWSDLYLDDCSRCGESVDKEQLGAKVGELIGIWRDAPVCGVEEALKPGYYIVKKWPFYLDAMLTGSFFGDTLQRVADLDDEGKRAAEDEVCVSGPICYPCQGKVARVIVAASTRSESEDSKDAARYRWLRNHPRRQFTPEQETEWWPSVWMSETAAYPLQAAFLDEAVDNAMRREVNDLLVAEYGPLHERESKS